jgi:hypothetical protein
MAKVDKSQYTKEEWHKIRAERRRKKEEDRRQKALEDAQKETPAPTPRFSDDDKNYVVCLKFGNKYGSEYVNTLYNMVKRNLTIPFEFVCFTEDPQGLDPAVTVMPIQPRTDMHGWWYKVMFFDPQLPLRGNVLFMDLDVVVFRNIDHLFTFQPDKFCIIRDFNRSIRRDWKRMNSSIFRLRAGAYPHVYDEFMRAPKSHVHRLHGDQDWIYEQMRKEDFLFWPDEWIQSYKWEMRDRRDLVKMNGKRNFKHKATPKVLDETVIAVFHGEPYPNEVLDNWVVDNWR